jgi:hypothetical protein
MWLGEKISSETLVINYKKSHKKNWRLKKMANIVFHRVSGSKKKDKSLDVDDKFISLQNRHEGAMIVKFRGPEKKIIEICQFFDGLDDMETVQVDIDNTGAVDHYFRGISPISDDEEDGLPIKKFNVTLQLRKELI